MMWECTLDVSGLMPWPDFWRVFHDALFWRISLFFRDIYWWFDECQLDLTTETFGSQAVAVGLGGLMVFWKAKDLIRNTAEGRQVQRPYRSHKWPCPREATIFCVLPRKIAESEWDKVVVNFRQKTLSYWSLDHLKPSRFVRLDSNVVYCRRELPLSSIDDDDDNNMHLVY